MHVNGNITAEIQIRTTTKNSIGENKQNWDTVGSVIGWLDYYTAYNEVNQYNAKIQDTTHIWICDVDKWNASVQGQTVTSENCRLIVKGNIYNVLLIDDPMELGQHLEIFLKYIGGGLGA